MRVSIVKFGATEPLELNDGANLQEALDVAGIQGSEMIRYRGVTVPADERPYTQLSDGASIIVAPPAVKHG